MASVWQDIYIFNVQPLIIDDSIVWDVFYVDDSPKKEIKVIRIFNGYLSFMISRLPTYTTEQTIRYLKNRLNSKIIYRVKSDLKQCEFYEFEPRDYIEIFDHNPSNLKSYVLTLQDELIYLYQRVKAKCQNHNLAESDEKQQISHSDYYFYKNTETPLRYCGNSTSISGSIYTLSNKYNIPLIGGCKIDTSLLTNDYPTMYESNFQTIGLKCTDLENSILFKAFKRDDNIDLSHKLTLLSYDIETYTPEGVRANAALKLQNEIMCIGMGFFSLNSETLWPDTSYCLITKDFTEEDLNGKRFNLDKMFGLKTYTMFSEYGTDNKFDVAHYIICGTEKKLLDTFIKVILKHNPQVITGFNNFGFDDDYVYKRLKIHKIDNEMLKALCYYDYEDYGLDKPLWFKSSLPEFKRISLKIDGDIMADNKTFMSNHVIFCDVYKLNLKVDAKRFTQQGYGTLNTMLSVYGVQNPFTNAPLSKTDMKISVMFDLWNKNKDIYKIALYCRQDAWITGTLLLARNNLGDAIAMANMSRTTFKNSIYNADGMRVNSTITSEAYTENFAYKDETGKHRERIINQEEGYYQLGGKKFDPRTIVGGAVASKKSGRSYGVVALDYSSQYPAQQSASDIDSSARVDEQVVLYPESVGCKLVKKLEIIDMYSYDGTTRKGEKIYLPRKIYYLKRVK